MSNESEQKKTIYELKVPEGQQEAIRLDVYITSFIENATRNKVQEAIKEGYVWVNGKKEKSSYKMMPGDEIYIELPKAPPPEAKPEELDLNIIHEDDDIIVVNKEAGMVVHPAFGNWSGTLVNGLMHHVDELAGEEEEENIRPGIVHRLDKDTSGILVVAKTNEALANLSAKFAEKDIERTYWAIVWGTPPKEGTIEGDIGRSKQDRKLMTVLPEGKGKHAVTHYKVLEYFDYLSLVEVKLETGRTHQIRVHFNHIGHQVFGDPTYGGASVRYGPNTGQRKVMFHRLITGLNRQALHAKTLGFEHPSTGDMVRFDSELPEDFQHVLDTLREKCSAAY
ncbi:MAG TPA: RNA pseudouridine synthase [Balneolaceae bacterium]|nr:RNA pseudouridine synthase [Balneolaceae bacterium]|tara:strand:+ start:10776 stop:11786 length:1011 start_codon:yes stop_codon:yes gene_type:complete